MFFHNKLQKSLMIFYLYPFVRFLFIHPPNVEYAGGEGADTGFVFSKTNILFCNPFYPTDQKVD